MVAPLGPRYLGFALPLDLTWRQGGRDNTPGRGVCSECGNRRDRVFARHDGALYCQLCIELDIASAKPARGQKHPVPGCPVERVYSDIVTQGGTRDSFDPTIWSRALGG